MAANGVSMRIQVPAITGGSLMVADCHRFKFRLLVRSVRTLVGMEESYKFKRTIIALFGAVLRD